MFRVFFGSLAIILIDCTCNHFWLQVQSVYDFITKGCPTRRGLNLRSMALLVGLPELYYHHLLPRSCLLQN